MAETPDKDEEYQFSDLESSDIYSEAPETNRPTPKKPNPIVTAFVVIVVVIAVYKLLGFFFGPKFKTAKAPAKAPVQIEAPAPVEQPLAVPKAAQPDQVTELLKRSDMERAAAQKISSEINMLRGELRRTNAKFNEINAVLQKLTTITREQQRRLNQQQSFIKRFIEEKKKKAEMKAKAQRVMYYIQAMVPGRAWLRTQDGKTLTVSKGDKIPGYGMVSQIDPQTGQLTMSLGDVIRYHPKDK